MAPTQGLASGRPVAQHSLTCVVADPERSPTSELSTVELALRGERIVLGSAAKACTNCYRGKIVDLRFYGSLTEVTIALINGMNVRARLKAGDTESSYTSGAEIDLGWNAGDAVLLAG